MLAQYDPAKIDSMEKVLAGKPSDSIAFATHFQIAISSLYADPPLALKHSLALQDIDISKMNYKRGVERNNAIAASYWQLGDFDKSVTFFQQALAIAEENKDDRLIGQCSGNLGLLLYETGDFDGAIDYLYTALETAHKSGHLGAEHTACVNIALVLYQQSDYITAIQYLKRSLRIAKELEEIPDLIHNNLATNYMEIDSLDRALHHLAIAEKLSQSTGDLYTSGLVHYNFGEIYIRQDKIDDALKHFNKARQIGKTTSNPNIQSLGINGTAACYNAKGRYKEALAFAYQALKFAKNAGAIQAERNAWLTLSVAHRRLKQFDEALKAIDRYVAIKDSLESMRTAQKLAKKGSEFQLMEQDLEIQRLEHEKQLDKIVEERQQQRIYGLLGVLGLLIISFFLILRSNRARKRAMNDLAEAHREVISQKGVIEEKNKDITDSILYARNLQSAILPSYEKIQAEIPKSTIFYQPRDIVSGDFIWVDSSPEYVYLALGDCTGHGVPGAMMSVLSNNILFNARMNLESNAGPDTILEYAKMSMTKRLNSMNTDALTMDGMDVALLKLSRDRKRLEYAGANSPMLLIRDGKLHRYEPNKMHIGASLYEDQVKPFIRHEVELKKGDRIFLHSDGYIDQFGGPKGKKLKRSGLEDLLTSTSNLSIEEQGKRVEEFFTEWKDQIMQLDDVTVIGFEI